MTQNSIQNSSQLQGFSTISLSTIVVVYFTLALQLPDKAKILYFA